MAVYRAQSDQELLLLLKEGKQAAFTEIYDRYWNKLLHFACQKTDNFMDAENVNTYFWIFGRAGVFPAERKIRMLKRNTRSIKTKVLLY